MGLRVRVEEKERHLEESEGCSSRGVGTGISSVSKRREAMTVLAVATCGAFAGSQVTSQELLRNSLPLFSHLVRERSGSSPALDGAGVCDETRGHGGCTLPFSVNGFLVRVPENCSGKGEALSSC